MLEGSNASVPVWGHITDASSHPGIGASYQTLSPFGGITSNWPAD
jgi:hypothetical protein